MKQEQDKETLAILEKGRKIKEFVKSESWGEIKRDLTDRLVLLSDLTTLSDDKPENTLFDIRVRKEVIKTIMGWVREIEGIADQQESNEAAFQRVKQESVIIEF